jgi:hypothetical protein
MTFTELCQARSLLKYALDVAQTCRVPLAVIQPIAHKLHDASLEFPLGNVLLVAEAAREMDCEFYGDITAVLMVL